MTLCILQIHVWKVFIIFKKCSWAPWKWTVLEIDKKSWFLCCFYMSDIKVGECFYFICSLIFALSFENFYLVQNYWYFKLSLSLSFVTYKIDFMNLHMEFSENWICIKQINALQTILFNALQIIVCTVILCNFVGGY